MQLPEVRTLAQLDEECPKLEDEKFRAEHHVAPTPKHSSVVKPDFAFVSTSSKNTLADNLAAAQVSKLPIKC